MRAITSFPALVLMAGLLLTGGGSAEDASSSPVLRTAMELMARASTTSEVLTLNLTNLLILLVLKALIFGFGLFAVGGVTSWAPG